MPPAYVAVGSLASGVVIHTRSESSPDSELWLSRLLAAAISDLARPNGHEYPHVAHSGLLSLTRREIEIITLICDGLTNHQIASRLFISETTVRHHLTSIFAKLDVGDRLKLAVYAYRHGLAAAGAA